MPISGVFTMVEKILAMLIKYEIHCWLLGSDRANMLKIKIEI